MPVINFPLITLAKLLEGLNYRYNHKRQDNLPVSGICFDSRRVKPGHIFIAVKGGEHDGHLYISEALKKGAVAVVAEQPPPGAPAATWIQVPDSRVALARMAANFFDHPAREMLLVGVTGTSGKTTTTSMLQEIYSTAGISNGLIGTVSVHCNRQVWPALLTTPDALELQRLLRHMADSGVSHVAMEVSSHGLAQKRVDGIDFHGTIFTNISPNHLDFHQTLQNYTAAKWRLASLVRAGGFVLANGDEPFFRGMRIPANVSHFFLGCDQFSHFRIHDIVLEKQGSFFSITIAHDKIRDRYPNLKKDDYFFHIPLLGKHNVFNGAAAAVSALLTGVAEENIMHGLEFFKGVERRLQFYQCGDLQVLDDTAMSPGSIHAVFQTLQELVFNGSDLVVVYAIRGRRGIQVNEDNGRSLAEWVNKMKIRHFFSTSSVNHVDEQNEVLPEEKEAFLQGVRSGGAATKHFDDLEEALAQAMAITIPGTSTLLLLGAQGMDAGLKIIQEQYSPAKELVPAAHRE